MATAGLTWPWQRPTNSPDTNTILNVLWVFPADASPDQEALLAGRSTWPALAHLDCGADAAANKPPRHDLVLVRMRNTGASSSRGLAYADN